MRALLCFASIVVVASAAVSTAQESKKEPPKTEAVKAAYVVKGLH